jgi:hypothetical protein
MQSLIGFKGRCRSYTAGGAGEGEGLKLDHRYANVWVTEACMVRVNCTDLSMAAAVTRVEFATSLTQS